MKKSNLIIIVISVLFLFITNSHAQKVEIKSTSGNPLLVESTSSNNYVAFNNQNGYRGYIGIWNGDNDLDFGTGGGNIEGNVNLVIAANPKLTLIPNGNVGIGVTDPDSKLEVNGQIKITGGSPGTGKVLTSDVNGKASWAVPSPPPPTTYSVGDFAQGGVVFWVSANGEHGKVVSIYEMGKTSWSRQDGDSLLVVGNTGQSEKNGANNTTSIFLTYGNYKIYAAYLCEELEYSGYDDWYLPAKDELQLVYDNRATINTTALANGGEAFIVGAEDFYWTSTEKHFYSGFNYWRAFAIRFTDGFWLNGNKSEWHHLRAVRSF